MQNSPETSKGPRIVFLVMSAVTPAATVDQLAQALAPHTVLVHHDFSQTPDFKLQSDNVIFVPDPLRTGWATFGFVEGIFHSLRYATENLAFDYLQLLSPTCLPVRPMREFEALVQGPADAHFGAIDMLGDTECLMHVGYRAYTSEKSLQHRVLRRLSDAYFGASPGRRDEAGIWLRSGGRAGFQGWVARAVYRAFSLPWLGRHAFRDGLKPYYGSVWFGARRHIIQGMVQGYARPGIKDYFSRLWISEEFLVPSLLMQLVGRKGPLNHFINRFDNAHPRKIEVDEFQTLRDSRAFFARKFPDDSMAPVRLRVLSDLAGLAPRAIKDALPPRAVPQAAAVPGLAEIRPDDGAVASRHAAAPALTTMVRAVQAARSGLTATLEIHPRSNRFLG